MLCDHVTFMRVDELHSSMIREFSRFTIEPHTCRISTGIYSSLNYDAFFLFNMQTPKRICKLLGLLSILSLAELRSTFDRSLLTSSRRCNRFRYFKPIRWHDQHAWTWKRVRNQREEREMVWRRGEGAWEIFIL